ncbi:2-phospho-L-lactate guanylyltransferase [Phycicoccus endophyticus]|uniref:2-phospho-L-lactate guanylyltransferase n=1 Tax=Phycicoccus endophyticus TaxID=1690220 RepID=UPI00197BCA4B|nr:2-phospho-L-lactate guanylyltransferase [Phycicoccus endophyticus]GGL41213.1 hypothetical protein GCM10012283_24710 [Phycicoccus endophyticus]
MAAAPRRAVVVPVKGGPLAKSRLELARSVRLALAEAFARDTLEAAAAALPDALLLVVTDDPHVGLWAGESGYRVVGDPGEGLDAAVAEGLRAACTDGAARASVLLGDHPALRPAELAAATGRAGDRPRVLVPDAEGSGTAMLEMSLDGAEVPPTRFGAGSARAHVALGYSPLRLAAPGLRTDVDDAESLAAAIALGTGRHTRSVLARATLPGVQATIHRPPVGGEGSALLDDGRVVAVPVAAVADSGLLHLRAGQRVSLELTADERAASRVWIVGIGPGETIR